MVEGTCILVTTNTETRFMADLTTVSVPCRGLPVGAETPETRVIQRPLAAMAGQAFIVAVANPTPSPVLVEYPPSGFFSVALFP